MTDRALSPTEKHEIRSRVKAALDTLVAFESGEYDVQARTRKQAGHRREAARGDSRTIDTRDRVVGRRSVFTHRRRHGYGKKHRDDERASRGNRHEEDALHDHRYHRHRGHGYAYGGSLHPHGEGGAIAGSRMLPHRDQPPYRANRGAHGHRFERHRHPSKLAQCSPTLREAIHLDEPDAYVPSTRTPRCLRTTTCNSGDCGEARLRSE
jgi:hypothetical protein